MALEHVCSSTQPISNALSRELPKDYRVTDSQLGRSAPDGHKLLRPSRVGGLRAVDDGQMRRRCLDVISFLTSKDLL